MLHSVLQSRSAGATIPCWPSIGTRDVGRQVHTTNKQSVNNAAVDSCCKSPKAHTQLLMLPTPHVEVAVTFEGVRAARAHRELVAAVADGLNHGQGKSLACERYRGSTGQRARCEPRTAHTQLLMLPTPQVEVVAAFEGRAGCQSIQRAGGGRGRWTRRIAGLRKHRAARRAASLARRAHNA